MKRLLIAAAITLLSPLAMAQTATGNLSVEHVWARSSAVSSQNAAVYLTLSNHGKTADRLLAASTAYASQSQIHRSSIENGVMQMREITDGIAVLPGKTVKFAPGGLHVMLLGIKQPLKSGEHFPLTLRFEKAGERQIEVKVQDAPAATDMEHMHMN